MTIGKSNARGKQARRSMLCAGVLALSACSGANGADGRSCTVADDQNGTMTITCPDGTTASVESGKVGGQGAAGSNGTDGETGTDGKHGTDGTDGKSILASVTDASSEQCAHGGRVILLGADDGAGGGIANDGILQPGEVDSTTPVCNPASGTNGHAALIAIVDTSAVDCPNGGRLVQSGSDDGDGGGIANDGVLQPGEVDATAPICHGTNGTNGTNGESGESSLVAIANATTAQCPTGGKLIGVGLDNGDGGGIARDGVLQPGEIDSTTPICNGASCRVRNNGNGTSSVLCDDGSATTFETGIFTPIDLGEDSGCGLRGDGSIACWGSNSSGKATPPSGSFRQISVSGLHGCALRNDGTVACWGGNASGSTVPPAGTFKKVSAGGASYGGTNATCGVKNDGTLACWGNNGFGQATAPAGTYLDVGVGYVHACALRTSQTLWCWAGTTNDSINYPAGTFTKLSVGDMHSCALRTDGAAICWGRMVGAPPAGTYLDVAAGYDFSCGVRADTGAVVCWGQSPPAGTPSGGGFVSVSAGQQVACAVRLDGSVTCWGSNTGNRATPPAFP